jgi:hypothetical protein
VIEIQTGTLVEGRKKNPGQRGKLQNRSIDERAHFVPIVLRIDWVTRGNTAATIDRTKELAAPALALYMVYICVKLDTRLHQHALSRQVEAGGAGIL